MNTLPFYILLFIHLVSLITAFGSVIVTDAFGLAWSLKKYNVTLPFFLRVTTVTQRLIWLGWAGLVCSGIPMLIIKGYVDELTQIKLFFVLLVGLNGIFLHLVKKMLEANVDKKTVPASVQFRAGITSAISQTGWWGAILIGFVHRHWKHDIQWPEHPLWVIISIALIFAIAWFIGDAVTKKRK